MDENPIKTARRLSRRADQNRCLLCGRKLPLEQHHIAGKNHDPPFTTQLCQACHALATENLRRADVDMAREENIVQRVRKALQATSVFLRMLSDALSRWAESLSDHKRKTTDRRKPH
jgi:uncharacterized protein YlaI